MMKWKLLMVILPLVSLFIVLFFKVNFPNAIQVDWSFWAVLIWALISNMRLVAGYVKRRAVYSIIFSFFLVYMLKLGISSLSQWLFWLFLSFIVLFPISLCIKSRASLARGINRTTDSFEKVCVNVGRVTEKVLRSHFEREREKENARIMGEAIGRGIKNEDGRFEWTEEARKKYRRRFFGG